MKTQRLRLALLLCSFAAAAACVVGPEDYADKRCYVDEDCPASLVCASAAPGVPKSCISPGAVPGAGAGADGGSGGPQNGGDGGVDGGTDPQTGTDGGSNPGGGDGGTGPYYCSDVKPILAAYCTSCHGSPPAGGAPSSFRLDVYETTTIPGAYAKAARIKSRASDSQTMPPSGAPQPTAAERATLAAWVAAGAPECADKPPPPNDGGTMPGNSVGYVSGPVSYAQHIQPLWDAYCTTCHNGSNDEVGDLDLRAGGSYSALMQISDEDNDYYRIVPGNPGASLLWIAISASDADAIEYMPFGSPGLKTTAPEDFKVIELWIQQGAPNN